MGVVMGDGRFANRLYGLPGGGAVSVKGQVSNLPLPNLWGMGLGKMGPRMREDTGGGLHEAGDF